MPVIQVRIPSFKGTVSQKLLHNVTTVNDWYKKNIFNKFNFAVTGTKHKQYILNYIFIFMQILESKDQYLTTYYSYSCNKYSSVTSLFVMTSLVPLKGRYERVLGKS